MSNEYYPLDIKSILSCGIEKWRNDFFWPISYGQLLTLESEVKQVLISVINENTNDYVSDLLVINYKLFMDYTNLLYSLSVLEALKQQNLKPLYCNDSISFKGLLETGIPLKSSLQVPSSIKVKPLSNLRSRVSLTKRHLGLTSPLRFSLSKIVFKTNLPYGFVPNLNALGFDYITNKLHGRIKLIDNNTLFYNLKPQPITLNQKFYLEDITKALVNKISLIATKYQLNLSETQKKYLHDLTFGLLTKSKTYLDSLNSYLSSQKPLSVLTGANGSYFSRMLSVAVRKNGGSVKTFQHGEPLIYNWDRYSWAELACSDEYYTYSANTEDVLRNVNLKFNPLKNNPVRIKSHECNLFQNKYLNRATAPLPSRVKKVMIVPRSFEPDNEVAQGLSFSCPMQLDWELRISDTLSEAGFEVVYKRHTSNRNLAEDFLNNVKTIYEPFEDVLHCTDAYIIYCTRTSTLLQMLYTNKPIIFIDGGWEHISEDMRSSFAKRCKIIKAHFDERNRLVFNKEHLIEALSQKPLEPDREFLNTYLPSF